MKILQVITTLYIGGAEKLIVDMASLFKERGHQVDVLLFDGTDTLFKMQLQEKGIKIYELSKGGSVYNPLFVIKLISYLKKYDIVHSHNTACQYYIAIAKILVCSKIKLVTTEHSTNNRRRSFLLFKFVDRFIYNRYDAVIAISEKAAFLLSTYLKKHNIHVILNGVNLSTFQLAHPIELKNNVFPDFSIIITMVARFGEAKDQATLIRAISLLPSNYCLFLIGGGDELLQRKCKSLCEDLNLTGRIVFAGIRSDISQILKASDIIVMSSHWEGFGLVAVEGMAAGKPVVASDVPGLAEVVNGAGILFPHENEKALASIIQNLMNDKDYYQQIAKQCMQRAYEYDIKKTVDAYLNVYKQCESVLKRLEK